MTTDLAEPSVERGLINVQRPVAGTAARFASTIENASVPVNVVK